jgi:hypothetical protein
VSVWSKILYMMWYGDGRTVAWWCHDMMVRRYIFFLKGGRSFWSLHQNNAHKALIILFKNYDKMNTSIYLKSPSNRSQSLHLQVWWWGGHVQSLITSFKFGGHTKLLNGEPGAQASWSGRSPARRLQNFPPPPSSIDASWDVKITW